MLDARRFYRIGDPAHRGKRGIELQAANGTILGPGNLAHGGRLITQAAGNLETHVDLALLGQIGYHMIRVGDLHIVIQCDITGHDRTRAFLLQAQHRLFPGVHDDRQILQVEQYLQYIFLHALLWRVLMEHTLDFRLDHGAARHGGEQNPTQRVTQGVSEATFQRLQRYLGAALGNGLHIDQFGLQEFGGELWHLDPLKYYPLFGIQFDDQLLVDFGRQLAAIRQPLEDTFH